MSLSSLGIGSGLDIRGLVDQLVAAERDPVSSRLARREFEITQDLSAFSRVSGALSSLESALDALSEDSDFDVRSVRSGDPEALGVSIADGAPLGNYEVTVERLAQRHSFGSAEQPEGTTFGGTVGDILTFTVGDASFDIDLSVAMDLAGVRDAINEAADGRVGAGIVNTDGGAQALVLTARDAGEANAISVAFGGTLTTATLGFSTLNTDVDGNPVAALAELDARLDVNGFVVTRGDNRVDDVLEGVTLDLLAADPGTRISVSVAGDNGVIAARMNTVVERYNALIDTIDSLTAFGGETGPSGPLIGDATIRGLQARVRDALGVGTRETLDLGIESDAQGRLSFDSGAFIARLVENPDAVALAVAGTDGVVTRLAAQVDAYSGSGGLIASRTDGLEARIDDIDDQRLALDVRLESLESRLVAQFSALDGLIAQFNTTGSFLAQQLANLPGTFSES